MSRSSTPGHQELGAAFAQQASGVYESYGAHPSFFDRIMPRVWHRCKPLLRSPRITGRLAGSTETL
jgi:hypothetical protein